MAGNFVWDLSFDQCAKGIRKISLLKIHYNVIFGCPKECAYHKINYVKIHQEWHHACLTIKTTQKTYNTMQSDTKLYYDGELVNKGIQKIYGTK